MEVETELEETGNVEMETELEESGDVEVEADKDVVAE